MYFKLTQIYATVNNQMPTQLHKLLPRFSYEQNDFRWKSNLMRNFKSDTEEVVVGCELSLSYTHTSL